MLLGIAAALGGAWYVTHRPPNAPTAALPEPAPVAVAPSKAEPVKVKDEPMAKPIAQAPAPEPKREAAPPKPKMPEPARKPAPAPVSEPNYAAIFAGDPLPLDERTATTPAAQQRAKAALDAALTGGKWDEWSALLRRSLLAAVKNSGPSVLTPQGWQSLAKNATFTLALDQTAFMATATAAARKSMTSEPELQSFARWLLATPAALESWLLTVRTDHDDVQQALALWSKLASSDPDAKGRYRDLAVACALVFEKTRDFKWNDQYVKISAADRYAFYTKHAAKGDLAVKPDKLTARDLVWVVGAPVPESELEWALQKMHLRQRSWGTAYEMVRYDMERAVKDVNKYDAYTFSEILKKGGICGDRAFFSANTARAAGIPASEVGGDGSRGPHAWVTWLSDENKWDFSGRYSGYPLGGAVNPQTGKAVSEQEFIRRSDRSASDAALLLGLRPVWLARAAESDGALDLAAKLFDAASVLGAKVPAVWQAKLSFWSAHRGDAPLEQWRAFLEPLKREMKADPDLLAEARSAEEKFVFPRQDSKLAMKELKKDARKLDQADSRTAVDQADQIAMVLKQQAQVLAAKGSLEPVRSLYDKAYRDHGRNPAVFKVLAGDCWDFVKADPEVAKKACRDMESCFRRYINSGGDYFDVTSQMSALEVISKCYREIGEDRKASALAKDVEKAGAKAARNAL